MTRSPITVDAGESLADAQRRMREHAVRHLPVLRDGRLVGVLSQRDVYQLWTLADAQLEVDRVEEAMSARVFVVGPTAFVRDVARVMVETKYGCAVVVDGDRVMGIFTSHDALRHLAEALP